MKKFKKASILVLILLMSMMAFAACGGAGEPAAEEPAAEEPAAQEGYVDGTYYAEMPEFEHGWKDNVTVTITDGKISAVLLNATNEDPALGDKLSAVAAGQYDMVGQGGAQAAWDVQAKAIQDYIVEKQDTTSLTFDEEGKSDAISGATISYGHFFDLVNEALAQAKAE